LLHYLTTMKISTAFWSAVALAGALTVAGCGEEEDPVSESIDGEAAKADLTARAAYPAGRFEANPPGSGPYQSITLRANGTFEAVENVVCAGPCQAPRVEGRFHFTRAGERRYLHLTGDDGSDGRWAWQKFGDELQIRKAGTTGWVVLGHVPVE
jgi:hypothetical protein